MTAHFPTHVRLFSPLATILATARGVDSPELDAQLAITAAMPGEPAFCCFLCEEETPVPAVIGAIDVPKGKQIFVLCNECSAKADGERLIFAKLGLRPLEHCGSA
jgi:hypothetical protein